ncbi:MAG: RNA methyltransferase substrate-binding domain-containing protein, partial [Actinomycetota bacterium]
MALAGIGTELEGIHAVEAALIRGRVTSLSVEQRRLGRTDVARIVRRAQSQGVPVNTVDDVRPLATTGAPQGVYAKARAIESLSIKDAVA